MSGYYSESARHIDLLKYEEKVALWSIRQLLGVSRGCGRTSLVHLMSDEALLLEQRFKGLFLHTVCAVPHHEVSSTEMHLLQVMSDMQNAADEHLITSGLNHALRGLSIALAAYGYWLPHYAQQHSHRVEAPQPTVLQDNYPLIMQAAE